MSALPISITEKRRLDAERLVAGLAGFERLGLDGLVEGMSAKAIAAGSNKSLSETEQSLASLMKKLNAETIPDVVRIGLYARLGRPD